ncbi:MAG: TIGR03905 family TSCPD domain-containing protein [Alistipes sp.]|nr:TIGR03905 family TSCPD domain-containing protein [Alistipes sp.]
MAVKSNIYYTSGTCSQAILTEVDGDTITRVQFVGGCSGNTTGIAALVAGMKIEDAISRLEGIDCAGRGTSCPDQLAKALRKIANE